MTTLAPSTGLLVLVVGASGVGKDTVLKGARASFEGDPRIVFARRTITREAGETEDNESVSEDEFDRLLQAQAFALSWHANNHSYGLRTAITDDLSAGLCVIANGSRSIINAARIQFERTRVVEIIASASIVAERLRMRGRESRNQIEDRLRRSGALISVGVDAFIRNEASPSLAITQFCDLVRAWTRTCDVEPQAHD